MKTGKSYNLLSNVQNFAGDNVSGFRGHKKDTVKSVHSGNLWFLKKVAAIGRCPPHEGFMVIFMGSNIREFRVFRTIR